MIRTTVRRLLCRAAVGALTFTLTGRSMADPPKDCPDFSIVCTTEYDPVICSDGNIYSNLCVATYFGCAEGCEPLGIGGIVYLSGGGDPVTARLAQAYTPIVLGDDPSAFMLVPIGGLGDCPDFTILCAAIYDPVICSDGNVYPNQCVATYYGCADGCVSLGGGVVEFSTGSRVDRDADTHIELPYAGPAGRSCG